MSPNNPKKPSSEQNNPNRDADVGDVERERETEKMPSRGPAGSRDQDEDLERGPTGVRRRGDEIPNEEDVSPSRDITADDEQLDEDEDADEDLDADEEPTRNP